MQDGAKSEQVCGVIQETWKWTNSVKNCPKMLRLIKYSRKSNHSVVFPVPRDEQYHGSTYQRLSRKGRVLPDPKCWAAHRIHYNSAYYPVCWRYQSGVERKNRMKTKQNKEQLFSVPETKNRRCWLFCLYIRLVLSMLLGQM